MPARHISLHSEKLDSRERRFVSEYLIDFKPGAAAIRAGFSPKSNKIGSMLTQRPKVAAEIAKRCMAMQLRLEVDADDVRRGLALIATHPFTPDKGGPTWGDRRLAWMDLARLLGMLTHKIQLTGTITLVDLLLAADKKMEEDLAMLPVATSPQLPALEHSDEDEDEEDDLNPPFDTSI